MWRMPFFFGEPRSESGQNNSRAETTSRAETAAASRTELRSRMGQPRIWRGSCNAGAELSRACRRRPDRGGAGRTEPFRYGRDGVDGAAGQRRPWPGRSLAWQIRPRRQRPRRRLPGGDRDGELDGPDGRARFGARKRPEKAKFLGMREEERSGAATTGKIIGGGADRARSCSVQRAKP